MPAIDPIANALVPADSAAADALGAPNYDEFQSDREVWELLQKRPFSVLRVTMPHCAVTRLEDIGDGDSEAAVMVAAANMRRLASEPLVRRVHDLLWVYEITRPSHPDTPQLGLGGMARTDEIRTPENPGGSIIRNEGIHESKARGRARLTEATHCDMGTVNLGIDDDSGEFERALAQHAANGPPTLETLDEERNRHRIWLVRDEATVDTLRGLVAKESRAYVADGNHRSAAAALLGYEHFLSVFFPARIMTIAPYNRLVEAPATPVDDLLFALQKSFVVDRYVGTGAYQPELTHQIGLYDGAVWWRLRPHDGTFDPSDAAQDIDADIVQCRLFNEILGLKDARDGRITYVGANRDAAWLQAQVDAKEHAYAVTLPPVTMEQFINVCLQNKLMPPKSTWFVPKIRSGLVMAMFE